MVTFSPREACLVNFKDLGLDNTIGVRLTRTHGVCLQLTMKDAEELLRNVVFEEWRKTDCEGFADTNKLMQLIDVFLPYLPLEQQHMPQLVELSLKQQRTRLERRNNYLEWKPGVVTAIANQVGWPPSGTLLWLAQCMLRLFTPLVVALLLSNQCSFWYTPQWRAAQCCDSSLLADYDRCMALMAVDMQPDGAVALDDSSTAEACHMRGLNTLLLRVKPFMGRLPGPDEGVLQAMQACMEACRSHQSSTARRSISKCKHDPGHLHSLSFITCSAHHVALLPVGLQITFDGSYPFDGAKVIDGVMTRTVNRLIRREAARPGCRAYLGCTMWLSVQGDNTLTLSAKNNTAAMVQKHKQAHKAALQQQQQLQHQHEQETKLEL